MCLLPPDERGLRRALALAREAVPFASPNPSVGCVLQRREQVLGEGAHHYDTFDHAEIVALKQARAAGHDLRNATVCVTLEPCAHHGRTAPCSDALIAAGIARCVIATVDPNLLVRSRGIARLRDAGVEVLVLPPDSDLAQQARRLNEAFAFSIQHNRPFVTLKAAVSIDGKLAPPPRQRSDATPFWLTGPAARADVQQLRHASDALLTGIGTVRADDPELTDRTGLPRRRPLLRVVLDSQLRTPFDSKLVRSATASQHNDLLILCAENASAQRESQLRALGADILRLPSTPGPLDLHAALAALAQRHIRSLLAEGGSALNGSLLRAQLADKVILYYSAHQLGDDALPFADNLASPYALQQQLTSTQRTSFPNEDTEDIRITGYLHDPWTGI